MNPKLRNMTAIYLFSGDEILLLYREGGKVVNNVWTGSAGGHFEEDELNDPTRCILRELNEELGLTCDDIENLALRYITLRYTNNEIRQNYYFFANLRDSVDRCLYSNEGVCRWFSVDEISSLEMPFTAKYVVEHYLREGHLTDKLYTGITTSAQVDFFDLHNT